MKSVAKEDDNIRTKKLAIWLHSKMCRCNHTDCCMWEYAIEGNEEDTKSHDWDEYSHTEYYMKAARLLRVEPDEEKIKQIIETAQS